MQSFSDDELAEIQLGRALSLFLDERDYVSSITLAAAAEELFGKCYRRKPRNDTTREIALLNLSDVVRSIGRSQLCVELSERNDVVPMMNRTRDVLKHGNSGKRFEADVEQEAIEMLERAIYNRLS
jgi:hypothetical protein